MFFPPVGGSPANGRGTKFREPTGTVLRSWTAADATHLHHTIFIKDGKPVCRGAGDSHLPQSMRARSPHVLSLVGGSPANGRAPKVREPTGQRITVGIPP